MTDEKVETPRTTAAICQRTHTPNVWGFKEHDRVTELVNADFARTLELETIALRAELEAVRELQGKIARETILAIAEAQGRERNAIERAESAERLAETARDHFTRESQEHAETKRLLSERQGGVWVPRVFVQYVAGINMTEEVSSNGPDTLVCPACYTRQEGKGNLFGKPEWKPNAPMLHADYCVIEQARKLAAPQPAGGGDE